MPRTESAPKLGRYRDKRDSSSTPAGAPTRKAKAHSFVVQEHAARSLHYDFRLELDGVLKSWAVPKGPSMTPGEKRLAVEVEDHPLEYGGFEGTIPPGQYGAGTVKIWDRGTWSPAEAHEGLSDEGANESARAALTQGKLKFILDGERLKGLFTLVRARLHGGHAKRAQWLLIKDQEKHSTRRAAPERAQSVTAETPAPQPAKLAPAPPQGHKTAKSAKVAGIAITHPDRVLFPAVGLTKLALAGYYERASALMLPYLEDRPVSVVRAPEGIGGERFFQKHADKMSFEGVRRLPRELDPGHAPLMVADSLRAVIGCVQMNAIEFHTWGARVGGSDGSKNIERPDRIVLDLDPDPQLEWDKMIEAVQAVHDLLDTLSLNAFVKTSGSKGMHIVIPLARVHAWADIERVAQALAEHLARHLPKRFSAKMGPQNRVGKIFVDYLRNTRSATTVAAYSVRIRDQAPVSMPLTWDEAASGVHADHFDIERALERIEEIVRKRRADPWNDYRTSAQRITASIRRALSIA